MNFQKEDVIFKVVYRYNLELSFVFDKKQDWTEFILGGWNPIPNYF
ncbi:hypothetical protein LEP1GSC161_3347 [Leptospira santarosai str. CBC1416]|uniref:Uncharacterized protein n=2 Tax=Leptospira santarosai TaxID=28183 RepID=K8Y6C0_9LEPT|nr:hypothetical protein LEP1GSC163_1017 [Leptospira santarosai str. CBC379]EKT86192.1 hypothetical protein LSS_13944 [Leptospira santarosai serovar Shermani str. LT 821]EMO14121.1 hypothetical protein LEP1GSC165_2170 [Leptospira santarosai str. CBC523]EMO32894.1 hypothetical protein LEP1GSC175_1487 [Leptospira santarosai str. HAI821]EMO59815.1 hypothetical protein LEP1GSC161_3347 [Leptospira santarosai str. CBC1416]EPG81231.1 hypothetical protein LEP1GSC048_3994 [Leptospira santarosai serovar 